MPICKASLKTNQIISLIILAGFSSPVLAAPGETMQVTGTAEAQIVDTSQLQPIEDLRFGRIVRPATAGTVSVDEDGSVSSTIDISQFPTGRGPATFLVRGDPRRFIVVNLPNTAIVTNGSANMTVDDFNANTFSIFNFARLNRDGEFYLDIGATLNIGANQEVGSYSGTFTVTVTYL